VTGEPLGLPKGSVRALMSVAVVVVAGAIAAVVLIREPGSDLTNMVVGGWATALGNVIGFYFGTRSAAE
jgi:predicted Kef-type K+ transport protein